MPLFSTSFEAIIFVLLILLWNLLEITSVGIISKLRGSGEAIKKKDNRSTLLLRGSVFVSVFSAILLAEYKIAMLPNWFFYPGVFIIVIGMFVRQWAIFTLGRFFTLTISVQKNQKVVWITDHIDSFAIHHI
jgi:protein-S-isoprenylcysteine O-methyltransferase Ste14